MRCLSENGWFSSRFFFVHLCYHFHMNNFTILDLLDIDLKEKNHLELSCTAGRSGLSRQITSAMISRPGLPLSGFFTDFNCRSIQLFGKGEQSYLRLLEESGKLDNVEKILSSGIPCCVFTDGQTPSNNITELAERYAIAILTTKLNSSDFSRRLYSILEEVFARTETIHGVLIEVFGIGVLITGDAGVGKSETALELISRGHRLISDDTVKLMNISDSYLVGSGQNASLAHHMEIRGLGIINVANMYGIGAIREKKQVQLSVHLEKWDDNKNYDHLGDSLQAEYLGIKIPRVEIPVKPGRNVPILIETAARNERLKKQGFYSAKEFDQNVMSWLESEATREMYYNTLSQEDGDK